MNIALEYCPSCDGILSRLLLRVVCLFSLGPEKRGSGSDGAVMCAVSVAGDGERSAELRRRFEALLEQHGGLISRICFSYAVDGDDYQDLRQDILLNIWKGLAGYRGDASSVTWVYRVSLNTCVSTVRRRSSRPRMERLDNIPFDFPAEGDDEGMKERLETLHRLISELTPVDKAIVTMWLDERSYEEIAEVTGVSRNNVGLRLHRIRERWRERV